MGIPFRQIDLFNHNVNENLYLCKYISHIRTNNTYANKIIEFNIYFTRSLFPSTVWTRFAPIRKVLSTLYYRIRRYSQGRRKQCQAAGAVISKGHLLLSHHFSGWQYLLKLDCMDTRLFVAIMGRQTSTLILNNFIRCTMLSMTSYFRQNSSFLFVILVCVFCSILNTTFNFSQLNIQLFTQLNIQLFTQFNIQLFYAIQHSTFYAIQHSTFHTIEHSTFYTIQHSTFYAIQHSTFYTIQHSTFYAIQHSTFHTIQHSTFLNIQPQSNLNDVTLAQIIGRGFL